MRVTARVFIAAAATGACACTPIHEGPTACPRACPAPCATDCFPSGHCRTASVRPPATPAVVRRERGAWSVSLGELPPEVTVHLVLEAAFDFAARGSTLPWDYRVTITRPAAGENGLFAPVLLDLHGFNAVAFPVRARWEGEARTDANGAASIDFFFSRCETTGSECVVLPASTVTASVVDPAPWEAVPACSVQEEP